MEHRQPPFPERDRPDRERPPAELIPLRNVDTAEPPLRRQVRQRLRLTLGLFAATAACMFLAGMRPGGGMFSVPWDWWFRSDTWLVAGMPSEWVVNGLTYAGALMLILFAHEMGHYLQSRRHGVPATLPFFIPFPISPFGTMGAVILQDGRVADRRMLFDIAVSGPLAGLVVALPVAYFGVLQAKVEAIPPHFAGVIYGDPLVLSWMVKAVHGPLEPNQDVLLNPLLFAGWVGIFITALNLIPIGQLDGGHILYTLIGRRAHTVAILLLLGGVAFMIYIRYPAYALMIALLMLMGPRHPPTADDRVPLGAGRILLGWLTLAFIVVGFTPVPIIQI